jgi:hypothetical protein
MELTAAIEEQIQSALDREQTSQKQPEDSGNTFPGFPFGWR